MDFFMYTSVFREISDTSLPRIAGHCLFMRREVLKIRDKDKHKFNNYKIYQQHS